MKRDDFERWFLGEDSNKVKLQRFGESYLLSSAHQTWMGWQACASQYEAERNSLLALIAEKDKALRGALACNTLTGDYEHIEYTLEQALALTPENVRLVEVGSMQNDMRTGHTYNILFNDGMAQPIGTKLYTIETIEAKGE